MSDCGRARRYAELDRLLCQAISAKGIPLDDLETIGWGIPLNAVGVDLEDPEFYAVHTDLLPILAPFGIDLPEGETYSVDVPECVYPTGRVIAASLHEQPDPALQQVGWLFGWLFSCTGDSMILCGIDDTKSSSNFTPVEIRVPEQAYTVGRILAEDLATHVDVRYRQVSWLLKWLFSSSGNSCVDWDEETMSSAEPLSWQPDDIAFAIDMIQEADGIMADALAGSRWLLSEPAVLLALWQNVHFLYIQLKKHPQRTPRLRLEWPDPDHLPTLPTPTCPLTGQECRWVKSG